MTIIPSLLTTPETATISPLISLESFAALSSSPRSSGGDSEKVTRVWCLISKIRIAFPPLRFPSRYVSNYKFIK